MHNEIRTIAYTRDAHGNPIPRLARLEIDTLARLPAVSVVGLPATTVREAVDTARDAVTSAGAEIPRKRLTATFTPADARVSCGALALALGILAVADDLPPDRLACVVHGRLWGVSIESEPGALDAAILARDNGLPLVCGVDDAARVAAVLPGVNVLAARTLTELRERAIRAPAHVSAITTSGGWPIAPAETGTFMTIPRNLDPRALAALRALEPGQAVAFLVDNNQPIRGAIYALAAGQAPTMAAVLAHDRAHLDTPRHAPVRVPHHTVSMAGAAGEARLAADGWLLLEEAEQFRRLSVVQARDARTRVVLCANAGAFVCANACAFGAEGRLRDLARDLRATVIDLREADPDDEPTERIDRSILARGGA